MVCARAGHIARAPFRRQHLLSRAANADALRRDAGRRADRARRCSGSACRRCWFTTCCCSRRSSRRRWAMFALARYLTGSRGAASSRGSSSRSCRTASSTTCTWSCSGRCGRRGRSGDASHDRDRRALRSADGLFIGCRCSRASTTGCSSERCCRSAAWCCCSGVAVHSSGRSSVPLPRARSWQWRCARSTRRIWRRRTNAAGAPRTSWSRSARVRRAISCPRRTT